ncbi:hypothetical protein [Candidatus Contendibacter odensensis]|uniref:Uncharacterized protein n=1 Tax=Candidatus Contendobacter odensis Run_B_J11 TaxID=1400861 RepID=A0A7U7G982_9GAMM|nr:hypothetical protein [Candidatus Contendobacter odensis]MBK8750392.1 hypothetical protein [Candidatus Competibacteraceae bacterium]CDH43908.1 hypothetical protein BN874_140001 [Candidatus Contendobacter odensis Run_B_J11]
MAEIKIKVVDEKLGAGTYEIYLQTHDEYTEEVERAENNLERYKPFFQKARFDTLDNDLKIANLIERDYKICLERISNLTSSTDTSMAPKIQRVFEAAIRVLVKVNTTLEDFHTTGIQGLFLQLQSCKLDEKAKKLVLALKPYQAALDKARKQKNEAWVQFGLDTAYTAAGLALGPLGIIGSVAGGIAMYAIDNSLGAEKTWYDDTAGNMEDASGTVMDALESYDKIAAKESKIIKTAGGKAIIGKMGTVGAYAGLYFNAKEVLTGHANIAEIERLMAEAKKKHEDLLTEYKKQKAALKMLSDNIMASRRKEEASGKQRAAWLRDDLAEEMRLTGYAPVN